MGRVGYEYEYGFSVDDEIVERYPYEEEDKPGRKLLLFEMRTVFMIKKMDGNHDDHLILGSETYDGPMHDHDDGKPHMRRIMAGVCGRTVSYRLTEYWMPKDEFDRFNFEALDFARNIAANRTSDAIIPIAADIVVRTVQLEGEPIEQTMKRAIRPEDLVPVYLWPYSLFMMDKTLCNYDRAYVVREFLKRVRFESLEDGLLLMPVCSICSRTPTVGTQMTVLPNCRHAFHSRCISLRLLDDDNCPSCSVPSGVSAYLSKP